MTSEIAVNISGLGKSFREEALLSQVDVEIRAGALIELTGPNGSGKTTLFRIIAGLDADHSGTVEVAGRPAAKATGDVAFLTSDDVCWPTMRAVEQIEYVVRRNGLRERWWPSMALLGDTEPMARLFSDQMSSGQRRRLSLALVLAVPATVVLLDEPWASLDTETCSLLDDVVIDMASGGVTVVAVTHQPRDLPWSAKLRIVDGSVIE